MTLPVRVLTFNIRFENDRDVENSWVRRRDLVAAVIRRYRPHLLFTQEGRWDQLVFLRERLPDYDLNAPARVVDETCQYPTIFSRKDAFRIVGCDEFWLSRTPRVHRSKDWDSAFPRMLSTAELLCLRSGARVRAAVTHLDHMGAEARLKQAEMIAGWVSELQEPVILAGDFNVSPGSPVHRALTSPGTGLEDSWQKLGLEEGPASYTHHGFTGTPGKARMDWVLVSSRLEVNRAEIIRDNSRGRYPSDHFPYMVDLVLCPDPVPHS